MNTIWKKTATQKKHFTLYMIEQEGISIALIMSGTWDFSREHMSLVSLLVILELHTLSEKVWKAIREKPQG